MNRIKLRELNKYTKKQKITEEEYSELKLEPVVINIKEIMSTLGLGDNYQYFKNSLDKIVESLLIIRKPNEKVIKLPLLQKLTYDPVESGTIEIIFNQELKTYLLPIKYFTEPKLVPILSFKSKYTPMLYTHIQMLKQLTKNNEIIIELDYLKIILGINDYYTDNFARFRTKILHKIIQDINNEYSDIIITKYETIRVGLKIKKIKFYIKQNKNKKKKCLSKNLKIYS